MAEPMTIQQRIAALNLNQVGQRPAEAPRKAPPPPPPPLVRSHSADNERVIPEGDGGPASPIGNQPAAAQPQPTSVEVEVTRPPLPTRPELRRPSTQTSQPPKPPSLPPRQTSQATLSRRDSDESISSSISATSSLSGPSTRTSTTTNTSSRRPSLEPRSSTNRVLAPTYDPSGLPPLPPKRSETEKFQTLAPTRPSLSHVRSASHTRVPTRDISPSPTPPTVPSRPVPTPVKQPLPAPETQPAAVKTAPVQEKPRKSALSYGFSNTTETAPTVPQRPSATPKASAPAPPPVPLGSRPNLAELQASKPRVFGAGAGVGFGTNGNQSTPESCLKCRDFSGPDNHAARFPRESIPSTDLAWLAHSLTDPFPSETDKARAIFTWLHHNIAYDCKAFFGGNCKPSTPGSTIASGLAVCEGYAGLFTALATHAGLESVVIGGHGKGFGHRALGPSDPIPAFNSNHAWNAVKIDNGEWKLVEPCWGAGHIAEGTQAYTKHFSPEWFTADNDEFGLRHFPKDQGMFFRSDGGVVAWETYIVGAEGAGEDVSPCGTFVAGHGIAPNSFYPRKKQLRVSGVPRNQRVQFQFAKICPHWDFEVHGSGPPYMMVLNTARRDARHSGMVPFQTNGSVWWCDVPAGDLGLPGQTLFISALTTFNGKDGRGIRVKDVEGRANWGTVQWQGFGAYQLV